MSTAIEARTAWQTEQIASLEKDLADRTKLLDQKIAALEKIRAEQKDFAAKAREETVTIYAKMRPEAAASELSQMAERDAAAVIFGLPAAAASRVLAEMEPARAARLAEISGKGGVTGAGQ